MSSLASSCIKINNNAQLIIKTITQQQLTVRNAEKALAQSSTHKSHIDFLMITRKSLKLYEDKLNRLELIKENIKSARSLNHTAMKWQLTVLKNAACDINPIIIATVIEDVQALKGILSRPHEVKGWVNT